MVVLPRHHQSRPQHRPKRRNPGFDVYWERAYIAETCMLHLNLKMPLLLNNIANEAEENYAASPERLYVIDSAGQLVYRGEVGPQGFNMDEWVAAIKDLSSK